MSLKVNGEIVQLDKQGFLKDLNQWNEEVAIVLAENEGIALNDGHWQVVKLLRDFYQQFEVSPAMRPLVKYTAQRLGKEKGNSMYLLKLFPGSPAKIAAKISGLPKPDNCL
jgi:tRNA 2-thiouridine synthesizing protein E